MERKEDLSHISWKKADSDAFTRRSPLQGVGNTHEVAGSSMQPEQQPAEVELFSTKRLPKLGNIEWQSNTRERRNSRESMRTFILFEIHEQKYKN